MYIYIIHITIIIFTTLLINIDFINTYFFYVFTDIKIGEKHNITKKYKYVCIFNVCNFLLENCIIQTKFYYITDLKRRN